MLTILAVVLLLIFLRWLDRKNDEVLSLLEFSWLHPGTLHRVTCQKLDCITCKIFDASVKIP